MKHQASFVLPPSNRYGEKPVEVRSAPSKYVADEGGNVVSLVIPSPQPNADWTILRYNVEVKEKEAIRALFSELALPDAHYENFEMRLLALIFDVKLRDKRAALEGKKPRDYRPREGIVNWLQAPDGGAPWLEAGLITKPFLFKHAPKAYRALRNYEKTGRLPADLIFLTRSAVVEREVRELGLDPTTTESMRRVARWHSAVTFRHSKAKREGQA